MQTKLKCLYSYQAYMMVGAHLVLFAMFSVLSINISNIDKNSVYHIFSSVHI